MAIKSCPPSAGRDTQHCDAKSCIPSTHLDLRVRSQNRFMKRKITDVGLQLDIVIPNEICEMNGGEG